MIIEKNVRWSILDIKYKFTLEIFNHTTDILQA